MNHRYGNIGLLKRNLERLEFSRILWGHIESPEEIVRHKYYTPVVDDRIMDIVNFAEIMSTPHEGDLH